MKPHQRGTAAPHSAGPARPIQRASADAVFAPQQRVLRPPPKGVAEELVPRPGGGFHVRSAQRNTLAPPTGTFNFVRVHGDVPSSKPILVSSRLPHAQLAGARPVVYAGTASFDRGEMAWWSNYSGTYQPIAAFRAQAGLPADKFVPWQKLQMGGVAMQRGTFAERRAADRPDAAKPARSTPPDAAAAKGMTGAGPGETVAHANATAKQAAAARK
jgi:hypothetical protein